METIFGIAKKYGGLPIKEIKKSLESPVHEYRVAGVGIMDKLSRVKKTSVERRKEIVRPDHSQKDRINNSDPVDLAALYVTGSYLFDKPGNILCKLAKSQRSLGATPGRCG